MMVAIQPGGRGVGGGGGGGVAVLMMAGLYEEAPPERGTFVEALGIRKGRDYTS